MAGTRQRASSNSTDIYSITVTEYDAKTGTTGSLTRATRGIAWYEQALLSSLPRLQQGSARSWGFSLRLGDKYHVIPARQQPGNWAPNPLAAPVITVLLRANTVVRVVDL